MSKAAAPQIDPAALAQRLARREPLTVLDPELESGGNSCSTKG